MLHPKTMKLPYFLEELNQGAEKAFGENSPAMIDSFLCAKMPPEPKRSVNMARLLENATYDEELTHLERGIELNALVEGEVISVQIMSTAPTRNGLLCAGIGPSIACNHCKKSDNFKDD